MFESASVGWGLCPAVAAPVGAFMESAGVGGLESAPRRLRIVELCEKVPLLQGVGDRIRPNHSEFGMTWLAPANHGTPRDAGDATGAGCRVPNGSADTVWTTWMTGSSTVMTN
jgi:hypothetical protein